MRRTRLLCRLALAGGATLLALTACSGGSNGNTASATSSAAATSTSAAAITSSSSAAASAAAPAGDAAFCAQAQNFVDQVQAAAQGQQQADFAQRLPALVSQLQSITPPPAIASDWQHALSALEQLAQAVQGVNLSDPQQLQQLESKIQPIEAQLGASGQHVEDYIRTQCGITAGSTG